MKRLVLTTALGLFSFGAVAADLPKRTIAPAPVLTTLPFSWTGFDVGLSAGLVAHEAHTRVVSQTDSINYIDGDSNIGSSGVGAVGGFQAGYNHQIGSLVLGVEADYSLASAGKNTIINEPVDYVGSKLTGIGTLRGRVGVAYDRTLLYGTGGLAYGRVKYGYGWLEDLEIGETTKNKAGWIVGAGVEYAMSRSWSIKAEGMYYRFGQVKYDVIDTDDGQGYEGTLGSKSDGVISRVGLNYRF